MQKRFEQQLELGSIPITEVKITTILDNVSLLDDDTVRELTRVIIEFRQKALMTFI